MRISKILQIFLFLLIVQVGFGQNNSSKEITGQIFEQSSNVEGVSIVNNTTQITAVSDADGLFSIKVKEGDVLVFSAVNLNPVKYQITSYDLNASSFQIKMIAKEVELKEVVVNQNANITAENLGIIPRGQKKYTPAERRLAAGSSFLGSINGNNEILRQNVEVEKKETYIMQLGYLFEDAYFLNYLKIPQEYIKGFKFYIVENENAAILLKTKNKTKLAYLMNELSLRYNEIIKIETK